MLIQFKEEDWTYRVLGIDNGTSLVGISVQDCDLRNYTSTVIHAETFVAEKTAYKNHPGLVFARDELYARCYDISDRVIEIIEEYNPHAIGIESPFQHQHAHSFEALTLSLNMIGAAVYRDYPSIEFIKVAPSKGKRAVIPAGVKYNSDKVFIRKCVLEDKKIIAAPGIHLASLGPDAIDSIAVGRCIALAAEL